MRPPPPVLWLIMPVPSRPESTPLDMSAEPRRSSAAAEAAEPWKARTRPAVAVDGREKLAVGGRDECAAATALGAPHVAAGSTRVEGAPRERRAEADDMEILLSWTPLHMLSGCGDGGGVCSGRCATQCCSAAASGSRPATDRM